MMTSRAACLALLALTAAATVAEAQINISIGRPRRRDFFFPPSFGTVSGYVPPPPVFRPPVGVVAGPPSVFRPASPVVALRPTIYSPGYVSQFSPGFRTILMGNVAYNYSPALPPGATFVQVGGAQFWRAGGLWFQPFSMPDRTIFLVVPPPF